MAYRTEDPWGMQWREYESSRESPEEGEIWGEKNRTLTWSMRRSVDMVAREEGIAAQVVEERLGQLAKLIPLQLAEMEGLMKVAGIVRLAVHAPEDVARRILELKAVMPSTHIPKLVVRCPALLVEGTDLAGLEAKLDAAEACTEGVPRPLLEELMVTSPLIFLMGEPVPGWESAEGTDSYSGDSLVGDCCKTARRILGLESDLQAVKKMIGNPSLIFSTLCCMMAAAQR